MDKEFIRIFNLYKNDVYRLAFSYTKSLMDADDITQNVFIKLYKHREIFNNTLNDIKKWLIKVTVNECKTLFLSAWKRKITPITEEEERTLSSNDNNNETLQAVMELPKKYRIVIYLYYYEGYKVKEIAKLLNISETNVQTRLSRAREQLKIILEEA